MLGRSQHRDWSQSQSCRKETMGELRVMLGKKLGLGGGGVGHWRGAAGEAEGGCGIWEPGQGARSGSTRGAAYAAGVEKKLWGCQERLHVPERGCKGAREGLWVLGDRSGHCGGAAGIREPGRAPGSQVGEQWGSRRCLEKLWGSSEWLQGDQEAGSSVGEPKEKLKGCQEWLQEPRKLGAMSGSPGRGCGCSEKLQESWVRCRCQRSWGKASAVGVRLWVSGQAELGSWERLWVPGARLRHCGRGFGYQGKAAGAGENWGGAR